MVLWYSYAKIGACSLISCPRQMPSVCSLFHFCWSACLLFRLSILLSLLFVVSSYIQWQDGMSTPDASDEARKNVFAVGYMVGLVIIYVHPLFPPVCKFWCLVAYFRHYAHFPAIIRISISARSVSSHACHALVRSVSCSVPLLDMFPFVRDDVLSRMSLLHNCCCSSLGLPPSLLLLLIFVVSSCNQLEQSVGVHVDTGSALSSSSIPTLMRNGVLVGSFRFTCRCHQCAHCVTSAIVCCCLVHPTAERSRLYPPTDCVLEFLYFHPYA
eukprot:GHVS01015695.1.p1 GENE.GHVS01015695.1~~GHVS01015695.1.p1  ORF type:complete len:270 (-),score=6.59 GHVS01015695.1:267-1076(-)